MRILHYIRAVGGAGASGVRCNGYKIVFPLSRGKSIFARPSRGERKRERGREEESLMGGIKPKMEEEE